MSGPRRVILGTGAADVHNEDKNVGDAPGRVWISRDAYRSAWARP